VWDNIVIMSVARGFLSASYFIKFLCHKSHNHSLMSYRTKTKDQEAIREADDKASQRAGAIYSSAAAEIEKASNVLQPPARDRQVQSAVQHVLLRPSLGLLPNVHLGRMQRRQRQQVQDSGGM
jgi:hypothetical protein